VNNRARPALAVTLGALVYIVANLLRRKVLYHIGLQPTGYWVGSIDALLIYTITLASGFIAGVLYPQRILMIGFSACAVGEFFRALVRVLDGVKDVGWLAVVSLPLGYLIDILFAVLSAGVLGAAGAAVSVVTYRHRSNSGSRS